MADLYSTYAENKPTKPHRFSDQGNDDLKDNLGKSTTLYVGNLSFYTTEEQIYALFSRCGEVKRFEGSHHKFFSLTSSQDNNGLGSYREDALRLLFCGVSCLIVF